GSSRGCRLGGGGLGHHRARGKGERYRKRQGRNHGFHGVRPLDDRGALWRDGRQSGPHGQSGQAVARKSAIASPSAGSVTLDMCVPGIVASLASASAATSSSAEPLSSSLSPQTTSTGIVSAASASGAVSGKLPSRCPAAMRSTFIVFMNWIESLGSAPR